MTSNFAVAGATRIGRRHEDAESHNQDNFLYRILPEQSTVVVAVSDGAGSAPKAKIGSYIAVRHAVNVAADELRCHSGPETALRAGLKAASDAIGKIADKDPVHDVEGYHCTLILAAWTPDAVAAIQVGDGAAVVTTLDGVKMLTIPQQGEYANETYFVTMPQAEDIAFFNQTDSVETLLLFTDGLQNQAIDFANKRPHADFVGSAINASTHADASSPAITSSSSWTKEQTTADIQLQKWLYGEQVAKHNIDDTTLVVVSRIPHDH